MISVEGSFPACKVIFTWRRKSTWTVEFRIAKFYLVWNKTAQNVYKITLVFSRIHEPRSFLHAYRTLLLSAHCQIYALQISLEVFKFIIYVQNMSCKFNHYYSGIDLDNRFLRIINWTVVSEFLCSMSSEIFQAFKAVER